MKYCTAIEVAQHNHEGDLWVSIFNRVLNLSTLVHDHQNSGDDTRAIVDAAGTDISHWFIQDTGGRVALRTHIHPVTQLPAPYLPSPSHLPFDDNHTTDSYQTMKVLHVPPPRPRTDFNSTFGDPWWADAQYLTAHLTTQPRKIRMVNTLTSQEHICDVCGEETLEDIRIRYLSYNAHAKSYVWKRLGAPLGIRISEQTLDENGIRDEGNLSAELRVSDEMYIPAIHLYFVDDLTFD